MLYKHWKKLALALTGFFWAGCEDSSSSAECLYGPPEDYGISSPGEDESSSASEGAASSGSVEPNSSSSLEIGIMPLYGVRVFESSSSTDESSSSIENSSSSEGEIIAPAYGVYDKVVCYDTSSDKQTLTREQEDAVNAAFCRHRHIAVPVVADHHAVGRIEPLLTK